MSDSLITPLLTEERAIAVLERLKGQQEVIEKAIGPTERGEALRVVLKLVDDQAKALRETVRLAHVAWTSAPGHKAHLSDALKRIEAHSLAAVLGRVDNA